MLKNVEYLTSIKNLNNYVKNVEQIYLTSLYFRTKLYCAETPEIFSHYATVNYNTLSITSIH